MTASQKAALSLLISVFLFAGVAVLAYTGLFDLIETRFYASSLTRSLTRETGRDARLIQDFLGNLQNRFAATLDEPAVRRSFLLNQSAEDIFDRTRIYGTLLESLSGLQWIRFVDYNGVRIHFSTYAPDIISQDRLSIAYRNYTDDTGSLPFERVQVSAHEAYNREAYKLNINAAADRIIFSFPFFDSLDIYRGTALFSISVRALAERLISENRIKIGDDISAVSAPPGIISGGPGASKDDVMSHVASIWSDGLLGATPFESSAGNALALISARMNQGIFYGRLINADILTFPQPMKVILLISVFLTVYLATFLAFNLKQDNMTIVQNRLKDLHISLIQNYYEQKGGMDWEHWNMELEQRRENIRAEVKRGIKAGYGRRSEENIDTLIDKSWDELLAVIGSRRKVETVFDEEKLRNIFTQVLQTIPHAVPAGAPVVQASAATVQPATKGRQPEEPETVDELESVDEVEELGNVEVLEEIAEAVEEAEVVEELEYLEALEEVEEAAEEAETAEEPEELDAVEEIAETVEKSEEIDEAEEIEELEELEEFEEPGNADAAPGVLEPRKPLLDEVGILARNIEFSTDSDPEDENEVILGEELEIVSPFASILSSLGDNELEQLNEEDKEGFLHKPEVSDPAPSSDEIPPKTAEKFQELIHK